MFKLLLGPDAHLALIEPQHAGELNRLIKNSYEHLREWSQFTGIIKTTYEVPKSL